MKDRVGTIRIDLVNLALLTIAGSVAGTSFFRMVTPLPVWGCFLLGLPLGAAFLACVLGGVTAVIVAIKKYSNWKR